MQNKKLSKLNIFANKRRVFIVSLVVVLVLLATVGTTLAFLAMKTQSVKNVFAPVTISCEVQDGYKIANTGDYSAYIRAAVAVNFLKDGDTTTVHGIAPVKNTDYTITFNSSEWLLGDDGFYYYKTPINANTKTTALITSFVPAANIVTPDGYKLSAQIIAEAIQSNPKSTVSTYWNVNVDDSGNITGKQ